jgi:hypothetical protein
MDEPRDDVDTWLQERVTPLLPHPGAFEQVRKRARRRKLGRAALAAAGAAVVVAGAITVPRLILSGGIGGAPSALSGATTPAHPSSPGSAQPTAGGTSGPDSRSATPTPVLPAPVPPNFAPTSVTFVSTATGWVIGQAGTPGQCANPDPYICTSLAITNDGGGTWHGQHAPGTGAPDGATGVSQVRSLDGVTAWAFGPQLYATHNGGQTWAKIATHGLRVVDLETVNRIAFAVWARCTGTGADFATGCTSFSLYSSPAGQDDWSPVPGGTGLQASGGTPASAQLVLTGARGYLMTPGGQLFSGPVTRPARWRTVTTPAGVPAALPCAPGAAESGGHPLQAMLASTGPGLVLLCASQASGNQQTKTLYYSADGGRSWNPAGPAPEPGVAMSLSGTPGGPVLVATSLGIDVSTGAPGGPAALTWDPGRGATARGGYTYVGMTTSDQGVAVPADVSQDAVWFTYDGGAHWQKSPVR